MSLEAGKTYDLLFGGDALLFATGSTAVTNIPYSTLTLMEISGRGEVKSGGGVIGAVSVWKGS